MEKDDPNEEELKELELSGHVTLREYRSGQMLVVSVNFAVLILVCLILIHLVTA